MMPTAGPVWVVGFLRLGRSGKPRLNSIFSRVHNIWELYLNRALLPRRADDSDFKP